MLSPADDRALGQLPSSYADALRLHEAGADAEAIAAQLGIEPEAVEPLLQLARAKLAAMLDADSR